MDIDLQIIRLNEKNTAAMRRLFHSRAIIMDLFDFCEESGIPLRTLETYFNNGCKGISDMHITGMARAFGMTDTDFVRFMSFHYTSNKVILP